jgi:hypothetical protein
VDVAVTEVDKGGSRRVFAFHAVVGADVHQRTLDDVDDHGADVAMPGKLCSWLHGEPCHHGAREIFGVRSFGPLATDFS